MNSTEGEKKEEWKIAKMLRFGQEKIQCTLSEAPGGNNRKQESLSKETLADKFSDLAKGTRPWI